MQARVEPATAEIKWPVQRTSMAVIWACMLFFALQASVEGLGYILGSLESFDEVFRAKYSAHITLVRTRAVAGVLALCSGLFAFAQETRRRKVHTLIGRLYALEVWVAEATSLPMALMAEGGWSNRLAFFLQGSLWLAFPGLAVWAARSKRFRPHRRFMVRNYALT